MLSHSPSMIKNIPFTTMNQDCTLKKTVPSLINKNGDILLVNNFFICKEKQTEEGKIASSLTADEAKAIMSSHFYNLNTTDGVIKVMMI